MPDRNRSINRAREVYMVSKPDALLSVYPKHVDSGRLREKIERCGFTLRDVYSEILLHNSRLEKGELFNFARARDPKDPVCIESVVLRLDV
jgi:hypothetical protein